ncbi:MAG: hypothetical protein LBE79_09035 [Tannerella sp.]|jgi:hypothetical protein|nr:hypothetical protein [Tannerella sp.]
MKKLINLIVIILMASTSCNNLRKPNSAVDFEKGDFGYDVAFLSQKDDGLIVLSSNDGKAQIIVSPKYQAKVFTSTANGLSGASFGFVNYEVLNSDVIDEHMNGYGGENRFWLGPEGGKYSVYFAKNAEQVFDNWHTPKPIDIEPWDVVSKDAKNVVMKKEMQVTNYLDYQFKLNVDRKISLMEPAEANRILGIAANPALNMVAYQTDNAITNLNDFEWTQETGAICIWILDMFNPAPNAVTVIPFNEGSEVETGKIVTSDYFGEIPADRLKVLQNVIFLKTDGNFRSKLGLNGKRTKAIAGNYDPSIKRLTITTFDVSKDAIYLNQEWDPTKNPLTGDALNAYNDGPLADGSIMGPFLELESVSPAAFLKPSQSLMHRHTVFHFSGEEKDLNPIAEKLLGVSIEAIKNAF